MITNDENSDSRRFPNIGYMSLPANDDAYWGQYKFVEMIERIGVYQIQHTIGRWGG